MIVFIDTNLLISAVLYPNSMPSKAYYKAVVSHITLLYASRTSQN